MTDATQTTTITSKVTAQQVQNDCPDRLQQIGKEILERFQRAGKQNELANNHLIAAQELLAEAKTLCDAGGFKKFRELFCPQLGKTQAYVLRAIGAEKTTFMQHRMEQRDRQRKSRVKRKSQSDNSVTVTENLEPEPDVQTVPTSHGEIKAPSMNMPETTEPRRSISAGDEVMRKFTVLVLELDRKTHKRPPEHFSATAVPIEILGRLGKLLTGIANIKKSEAGEPALVMVVPDNGTVSIGEPAEGSEAQTSPRASSALETRGV